MSRALPFGRPAKLAALPAAAASDQREVRPALLPVVLTAVLFGTGATVWAYVSNTILAYGDAQQHLAIARRVLDSRTPSVAQLGTVWLPLPHILLMLFVYINPLWRTGLAGSILGVACLGITATSLFLSVWELVGQKSMAWVAVAVLLSNPNVLYTHTTALTEPVLMASMTSSIYFLIRWTSRRRWPDLVVAGCLAAAAVLSRYEGWALALIGTVLVSWVSYMKTADRAHSEGVTLAFSVPPAYAVGMWAFYNWVIFGDPLAFLRGQYSAQAQTTAEVSASKGQLLLSFLTYSWATIDIIRWPLLITALLGLISYLVRTRLKAESLMPYLFLGLFCFDVALLFLGQINMITPQSRPAGIYNIRYALLTVLGVSVFVAYLGSTLARFIRPGFVLIVVGILIALQTLSFVPNWPSSVMMLDEAQHGAIANPWGFQVASFLRSHYRGGGILVDESTGGYMTPAGIRLKDYVASFNGQMYLDALRNPVHYARWVVLDMNNPHDRVAGAMNGSPLFHRQFKLLKTIHGFDIYEARA